MQAQAMELGAALGPDQSQITAHRQSRIPIQSVAPRAKRFTHALHYAACYLELRLESLLGHMIHSTCKMDARNIKAMLAWREARKRG